jgi:hypothetical protein
VKLKKLAEVTMWLPGFAPDDPLPMFPTSFRTAEIIAFPLVASGTDRRTGEAGQSRVCLRPSRWIARKRGCSTAPAVLWPSLDAAIALDAARRCHQVRCEPGGNCAVVHAGSGEAVRRQTMSAPSSTVTPDGAVFQSVQS